MIESSNEKLKSQLLQPYIKVHSFSVIKSNSRILDFSENTYRRDIPCIVIRLGFRL
jgi:hypothetical protein